MVGDDEDIPMVEILSDSGDDETDEPARPWGGHEVVRTLAAVVTRRSQSVPGGGPASATLPG